MSSRSTSDSIFDFSALDVSGNDAVLEFLTEVDGIAVNGVDMIRWNDEGKIVDFKVMIRPLKAVNLLHGLMRQMLEQGGSSASTAS